MIKFKHKEDMELLATLHPILIMIFADAWNYAYDKHGVHMTVTQTVSTYEQDKKLNRVSDSHRTKRAIDVRTKDLPAHVVYDVVNYINEHPMYTKYHYVSRSGATRLAYWHNNGNGEHLHIAIHSKFAIREY